MNIVFLDIDGPLIPFRMYYSGDRRFSHEIGSFLYDPIAVGMINKICENCSAWVVFNSSHCENPPEIMRHQGLHNGIVFLHDDCTTKFPRDNYSRLSAIEEWISRNSAENWIVIDDVEVHPTRQVIVDYNIGMTIDNFYRANDLFNVKATQAIYVGNRDG